MGAARLLVLVAVSVVCAGVSGAQRVRVSVLESDGTTPAAYVAVLMLDSAGVVVSRGRTGTNGTVEIPAAAAGRFRVRALRVGFAPTLSEVIEVAASGVTALRLPLVGQRIVLPAVQVIDRAACTSAPSNGGMLLDVWDQARAALLGAADTTDAAIAGTTSVSWMRVRRLLPDTATDIVINPPRRGTGHAFRSRPAAELVRHGFMTTAADSVELHAPDAQVLLDPEFATWYCFGLVSGPAEHPEWIGLTIRAQGRVEGRVTVNGTLWMTRDAVLQRFEYRYEGLDGVYDPASPGGRVEFLRLPSGQWIVSRWMLRMGEVVTETRRQSVGRTESRWSRTQLVRIVERGAWVERVDLGNEQFLEPNRGAVAMHLVAPDQTAEQLRGTEVRLPDEALDATVADGHTIELQGMQPGRYRVLVRTPLMRDVGLLADTVDLTLVADEMWGQARLPVPSPSRVRRRLCPANPRQAVAVGILPSGSSRALRLSRSHETASAGLAVTIDAEGRWHACGLDRNASYTLWRGEGPQQESIARFRIPRSVDLAMVGAGQAGALEVAGTLPTAPTIDSDGARLTLRAFSARDSTPLLDAQAVLDDTLLARPLANGEIRFSAQSPGDHLLTVRRLGLNPSVQTVTLTPGAPLELNVYLDRLPQLLSEVVVRGRTVRVPTKFVDVLRRSASGWGTVFSREDFKDVLDVKSVLWRVPGVLVNDRGITFQRCQGELPGNLLGGLEVPGEDNSRQKSTVGYTPSTAKVQVYIDGVRTTALWSDTGVDPIQSALSLVPVRDIEFMEVYRGTAQIPVEFINDACAVIAIWTRAY